MYIEQIILEAIQRSKSVGTIVDNYQGLTVKIDECLGDLDILL